MADVSINPQFFKVFDTKSLAYSVDTSRLSSSSHLLPTKMIGILSSSPKKEKKPKQNGVSNLIWKSTLMD